MGDPVFKLLNMYKTTCVLEEIHARKVRILFDDGNTYLGIIVRKDPETDMWVTVFEDGEEDQTADPATDSDYTLLAQVIGARAPH